MSWKDKITENIRITTGDGRVWEVLWNTASKNVEWNGTTFPFIKVPGSLGDKQELLAREFPLEFYFQGEDHLEDSQRFENSLSDKNAVLVEHPYYGNILAHIFSIKVDNSYSLNCTKINCTAIETIDKDGLRVVQNPVEVIDLKKIELDTACEAELTAEPTITDVNTLSLVNESSYEEGIKIITIPEEAEEYFNVFNEAASYVDTITASPILAMQATINLLNAPSQFTASVQNRVRTLLNTFDLLRRTITGLSRVPSKQLYQIQGTTIISALCKAATTPLLGDYTSGRSALSISTQITTAYNQLLEDLDELQDPHGANPLFFVPGFNIMGRLADLVNLTTSSLLQIALNGKREHSVVLMEESNVILLTHKYYGLYNKDANIDELIKVNNFSYRDMLGLEKGRTIVYYK